jgi:type IX secretion system substrate protein
MKTIIIIFTLTAAVIVSFSQRTYIWSGAVNSNFSTAGNWNPVRQIGLSNDNLVFNSGTNLDIVNVYQVTVGQIAVQNHTHVKLSPASGNPKTIFVQGAGASQNSENWNEHSEISHVKYDEYMNSETTGLADTKYNDYMKTDSSDLAAVKYNEYKNPPVKGMGDIKEELSDDPNLNEDLLIDTGSSLMINASDPRLSIYLKHSAKALINGTLAFTGEGANEISSFDSYAITFKPGSELIQSCPGNIFSNTGVNHSALFENGSTFIINHAEALDPFGLTAPSSKVAFDSESMFKISSANTNAIRINGRILPNFSITGNSTVNIQEMLTSDIYINNLNISQGSRLLIRNLMPSSAPAINIKGNLYADGELHFIPDTENKVILNFNRGSEQFISGSGVIELSNGIQAINIQNDLTLDRDLEAYCHIIHHAGIINTNGHTFKIFNQFTSTQMLFAGIIILPEQNPENKPAPGAPNLPNQTAGKNNSPKEFSISQNYPNPFNPKTKIKYELAKASKVNISVFDITGRTIISIVDEYLDKNYYTVDFDGSNLASGIYFYRIIADANGDLFKKTLKMSLIK